MGKSLQQRRGPGQCLHLPPHPLQTTPRMRSHYEFTVAPVTPTGENQVLLWLFLTTLLVTSPLSPYYLPLPCHHQPLPLFISPNSMPFPSYLLLPPADLICPFHLLIHSAPLIPSTPPTCPSYHLTDFPPYSPKPCSLREAKVPGQPRESDFQRKASLT